MDAYVYILSCDNWRYYIGSTNNISRRLKEHERWHCKYTRHIRPVKLVNTNKYGNLKEARQKEWRIKKMKDRKYIEKLLLKV